jgi:hypothetical protein
MYVVLASEMGKANPRAYVQDGWLSNGQLYGKVQKPMRYHPRHNKHPKETA